MTVDECRDWLAYYDGWEFKYNSWWHPDKPSLQYHPYSPTLDSAARALNMPMRIFDFHFNDTQNQWIIRAYPAQRVTIGGPIMFCYEVSGPDEVTARYRLAVACRRSIKESEP